LHASNWPSRAYIQAILSKFTVHTRTLELLQNARHYDEDNAVIAALSRPSNCPIRRQLNI